MPFGFHRDRGRSSPRDELLNLAKALTQNARAEVTAEGFHAPMYLLWIPGQELQVRPFTDAEVNIGHGRDAQMAQAVRETGATAVAFIAEGWSGPPGDQFDGSTEVLLVAAADVLGNTVVIESPLASGPDGRRRVTGGSQVLPEHLYFSGFELVRKAWAERQVSSDIPEH